MKHMKTMKKKLQYLHGENKKPMIIGTKTAIIIPLIILSNSELKIN